MEPIAIFIILAVGLTVLVAWAVSFSTNPWRNYDYNSNPAYGYPYPPPYPYPPRGDSSGTILVLALLGFLLFAGMRYYERMEQNQDTWQELDRESTGSVDVETDPTQRMETGGGGSPTPYDEGTSSIIIEPIPDTRPAPESKPLEEQLFVQLHASGSELDVLDAARQYLADYPGSVWIGDKESDWKGQFKILIGPYDTREAAKAVHGSKAWVRVPSTDAITLYRPE